MIQWAIRAFGILLFLGTLPARSQVVHEPSPIPADWTKPYPPFRVAGNLYYVGSEELACFLITTSDGLILINTGVRGSDSMICSSIRKLGFDPADIRILLTTQAHFDHMGGMAAMKRISGARFLVQQGDAAVVRDGGNSDFVMGGKGSLFEPLAPDGLLGEQDTLRLGGVSLLALHHPGHTRGSCSYLLSAKEGSRTYRVLIANMPTILHETDLRGMPSYPEVGRDYASTFRKLRSQQFDLWLASHASQFGLHTKRKPGTPCRPSDFAGREDFDRMLNSLEDIYNERLQKAER